MSTIKESMPVRCIIGFFSVKIVFMWIKDRKDAHRLINRSLENSESMEGGNTANLFG